MKKATQRWPKSLFFWRREPESNRPTRICNPIRALKINCLHLTAVLQPTFPNQKSTVAPKRRANPTLPMTPGQLHHELTISEFLHNLTFFLLLSLDFLAILILINSVSSNLSPKLPNTLLNFHLL